MSVAFIWASLLSILYAHQLTHHIWLSTFFLIPTSLQKNDSEPWQPCGRGNSNINQWSVAANKVTTHLHKKQLNKQRRAAVPRRRWVERLVETCNTALPRPITTFANQNFPKPLFMTTIQNSSHTKTPWTGLLYIQTLSGTFLLFSSFSSPQREICRAFTLPM